MAKDTAIVPATPKDDDPGSYLAVQHAGSLKQVVEVNTGGQGVTEGDLDKIVVPGGGVQSWEVETLEGTDSVKELVGVVVGDRPGLAFWEKSFEDSDGGSPPDCSCQNPYGPARPGGDPVGIGLGNPGGNCKTCPNNQWGSSPKEGSNGKACREYRLLFLVTPDSVMPKVVKVPATSLAPVRKFFNRLSGLACPYTAAVLAFGLEKKTSPAPHSVITVRMVKRMSEAEAATWAALAKAYGPLFDKAAAEVTADGISDHG